MGIVTIARALNKLVLALAWQADGSSSVIAEKKSRAEELRRADSLSATSESEGGRGDR